MDKKQEDDLKEKKEDDTSKSSDHDDEKKEEDEKKEDKSDADKKEEDKKSDDSKSDEGVDYKAELERVTADKKNLETALFNEKDKNKKLKQGNNQNDDDDENEDDVKVTPEQVAEIVRRENEKSRLDSMKDALDEGASAISSNDDEKALILFHYTNTLQKSGLSKADIKRDLERAKLLANAPKLKVTLDEAKRKIDSEKTKNKKGNTSSQKGEDDFDPSNLSDADRALMKRHGLSADDVKKTRS